MSESVQRAFDAVLSRVRERVQREVTNAKISIAKQCRAWVRGIK